MRTRGVEGRNRETPGRLGARGEGAREQSTLLTRCQLGASTLPGHLCCARHEDCIQRAVAVILVGYQLGSVQHEHSFDWDSTDNHKAQGKGKPGGDSRRGEEIARRCDLFAATVQFMVGPRHVGSPAHIALSWS